MWRQIECMGFGPVTAEFWHAKKVKGFRSSVHLRWKTMQVSRTSNNSRLKKQLKKGLTAMEMYNLTSANDELFMPCAMHGTFRNSERLMAAKELKKMRGCTYTWNYWMKTRGIRHERIWTDLNNDCLNTKLKLFKVLQIFLLKNIKR